jgi:NAD+ synthase (glutamine-hydrolysing)
MKIALAQMKIFPGQPEKNLERMEYYIDEALKQQCSIIAFPEMCVGGYLLGDKWVDEPWCEYLTEFNDKLRLLSENIVLLYGNVYLDKRSKNKDGRVRKYNAAYGYYKKEPLKNPCSALPQGIAIKSLLPNYRIFDDERYFFSLQELSLDLDMPLENLLQPFEITLENRNVRIGVEICEDLWFNDYRYKCKPLNVTGFLIKHGAEMIFNLSSSPWTYGKNWARNNRIKDSHADCGSFVPFYYVNCVSVQNNGKNIVVFDGDSTIYNENAEIVKTAESAFTEEMITIDTTVKYPVIEKPGKTRIEAKFQAVIEGIRGMDTIMGSDKFPYVIGLSGGIDSALVACLLKIAVGKERIVSLNLPTKYNSNTTRSIAKNIAEYLEIPYHVIPIEDLVTGNTTALCAFNPSEFNCENIQAKIRGTSILSNVAGILNGLMVCNGNKVEIALGYATLYGDVNGGIAPIGDLLKTEVFEMARFINDEVFKQEVIPTALIPDGQFECLMPPSAELKNNQVDPMKWGYHDALVQAFTDYRRLNPETVLEWYRDGLLSEKLGFEKNLFFKYGLNDPMVFIDDLEWVVKGIQRAVFKRIQSPPVIILSKGSYGYDIRESQLPVSYTGRYQKLKQHILLKVKSGVTV